MSSMNGAHLRSWPASRCAKRRGARILWTALVAARCLLAVFAVALRLQVLEFQSRPMSPFLRYQVESGMLMVGLYTCDLLAVVMTILTSIDTLAGEISSGTIHAIATKPVARWQILAGKFLGFACMVIAVRRPHVRRHGRGGVRGHRACCRSIRCAALLLIVFECCVALA